MYCPVGQQTAGLSCHGKQNTKDSIYKVYSRPKKYLETHGKIPYCFDGLTHAEAPETLFTSNKMYEQ